MARKFLTPIDLNKLELQNAAIQNLATDPESPVAGQVYYNTAINKIKVYNGSSWVEVGNSQEQIEDAIANLVVAGEGISENYNDDSGTLTITNTGVLSLLGTTNEVEVSASAGNVTVGLPSTINADTTGNAATATALETSRTISISGGASGSASFNGTQDIDIALTIDSDSAVSSITGTENEITVSASVGAVTISLPDTIAADISGTAASATYAVTAGTANSVAADSVALGTDTTGSYVQSVSAGTGVTVTGGTGEGSTPSIAIGQDIATTANPTFAGVTGGNVTVGVSEDNKINTTAGNLTIDSFSGTTTIDDDLNVTGNLSVAGTTTTINTETILVADNIITLNSNADSTPTENAGIEVERGSSTNTSILWNESNDNWTLTNDGTNYHAITRKYSANVGDAVATSFNLDHNLGTRDVTVQVYDNSTYDTVEVDVVRTSDSRVTVSFATAPGSNAYRVVIVG